MRRLKCTNWASGKPLFPQAPKMKISLSRSSILTTLAIAILIAALPGAIARIVRTGNLYLLSNQFFEDMLARFSGAGRLRFILQPMVATFIGMRDGIRDSRVGCPPFLLALVSSRERRTHLLRSALASVRDLVAVAIILDVISQFLIFEEVHPGAAVPYSITRALANPISRSRNQKARVAHPD
jgi:hypothetical protein